MDDIEPGQLLVIKMAQIWTVIPNPGERACQVFRQGELLLVLSPRGQGQGLRTHWLCLTPQGVREFYASELSSRTVLL
jgi:hypothetical protein